MEKILDNRFEGIKGEPTCPICADVDLEIIDQLYDSSIGYGGELDEIHECQNCGLKLQVAYQPIIVNWVDLDGDFPAASDKYPIPYTDTLTEEQIRKNLEGKDSRRINGFITLPIEELLYKSREKLEKTISKRFVGKEGLKDISFELENNIKQYNDKPNNIFIIAVKGTVPENFFEEKQSKKESVAEMKKFKFKIDWVERYYKKYSVEAESKEEAEKMLRDNIEVVLNKIMESGSEKYAGIEYDTVAIDLIEEDNENID